MVELSRSAAGDERLSRTFAALADPTRRSILSQLRAGDATISELAAPFDVSFAAVSKHVAVLERARLVEREVVGREHRLRLVGNGLRTAAAWTLGYRELWERRLDALDRVLRDRARSPHRPGRRKRPPAGGRSR